MTNTTSIGTRLSPPRLPVVAMTDLVRGWWPGLSKVCSHCTGRMWLTPPTLGVPGSVTCLLCERETATVVERIIVWPDFSDLPPVKRGRRPSSDSLRAAEYARRQAEYRERKAVAV